MENNHISALLAKLRNAKQLSALELNAMRFSGKKTIITEARLKNAKKTD